MSIELAGHTDALYRTLGLLVRQLHVRGLIEAPDLVREMRRVADQEDPADPRAGACIDGLEGIAASFERDLLRWNEARAVHALYQGCTGQ